MKPWYEDLLIPAYGIACLILGYLLGALNIT